MNVHLKNGLLAESDEQISYML